MKTAVFLALLSLAAGCAPAASGPVPPTTVPGSAPHAHLSFPPLRLDVETTAAGLSPASLGARLAPTDGPLLPCSIAGAAIVAAGLQTFWSGIERGEPQIPPPGTNILGRFDADLRRRQIPRADPARTAEIIARLYIWNLWAINAWANTLVARSTQAECLNFVVSNPTIVQRELSRILGDPNKLVYDHYAAIEHYSPTVLRPSVDGWLSGFESSPLMARAASWTDNPLAPCSVLRSLMMASRVYALWQSMLDGSLRPPAPDDPVLGRYASALSEGSVPRSEPGQTMQIAARLFGARMTEGAGLTERYLADSTQRECVDEIFQPGLIRVRLLKEGKLPQLRE
ncbi:MAG TPA: hypothetical protein VJZ73_05385 [Methylomirabilota bacterium]|nr:hypothetical protein [Methylomirabilota bacterium]